LLPTALVLGAFVIFSIVAGLYLRGQIASSIQASEAIRASRTDAFAILAGQLDEETGIRGYSSTGNPVFLEPYRAAVKIVPASIASLRARVLGLRIDGALPLVDRAAAINRTWLIQIAAPVIKGGAFRRSSQPLRGKELVDQFRATMHELDADLDARYLAVTATLNRAITRTALLLLVLIVLIAAAAVFFSIMQARAAHALERERARRIAQGEEAAGLRAAYETEKHIADTLQDAFSQRPLPTHPALRFSAMYVPAAEESKVGGDWYDALELPGNRVLFAIGDVAGHGIDAAVGMNRARQSLMSAALLDGDPAAVLSRVNADLLRQDAPMVTGVVGFADARTFEFVYSTAGHPPPVLMEPGRAPRMLELGGLPLGVSQKSVYRTHRVQSVPGATLILYTDGAVEHTRNVLEGERLLLDAVGHLDPEAVGDTAASIHRAIFQGRLAGDDVAILTIGFTDSPSSGLKVTADRAQTGFSARIARSAELPGPAPASLWRKAS
jgi:serine phosphatase RsbU (regulator of sigma subunit)